METFISQERGLNFERVSRPLPRNHYLFRYFDKGVVFFLTLCIPILSAKPGYN